MQVLVATALGCCRSMMFKCVSVVMFVTSAMALRDETATLDMSWCTSRQPVVAGRISMPCYIAYGIDTT